MTTNKINDSLPYNDNDSIIRVGRKVKVYDSGTLKAATNDAEPSMLHLFSGSGYTTYNERAYTSGGIITTLIGSQPESFFIDGRGRA